MPDDLNPAAPQTDASPSPEGAAPQSATALSPETASSEPSSTEPSLWDRLFRNRGTSARSAEAAATDQLPDQAGAGAVKPTGELPTPTEWKPPSWQSEQEYQSWLRSENQRYADTREHQREQQTRDSRIRELESGIRDAHTRGDSFTVDELVGELEEVKAGITRERDQVQEYAGLVGRVTRALHTATIEPLLAELPKEAADKLLARVAEGEAKGEFDGVSGRAYAAKEALKALKAQWTDDGERKARQSPALRQQVRVELRPDLEEPEHLVGAGVAETPDMNTFFRRSLGRG